MTSLSTMDIDYLSYNYVASECENNNSDDNKRDNSENRSNEEVVMKK